MPIEFIFMTFPGLELLQSGFLIYIQVFQDHENPGSSKIKTVFEGVNQDKKDHDKVF